MQITTKIDLYGLAAAAGFADAARQTPFLSRRLHGVKKVKNPDAQQAIFQEMAKEIDQAAGKVLLREAARPANYLS